MKETNQDEERKTSWTLWLSCLVLFLSLLAGDLNGEESSSDGGNRNRFNVLFIAIDDLRPELGCYGVDDAQTPCLDSLAQSGVVFKNHYVQVPTCGASRYALLTGRSPFRSGVTRNNNALFGGSTALNQQQLAAAQSMPELFRRSGYETVCIGKISHTPDGRVFAYNGTGDGRHELPHAWDKLSTPFGKWKRGWGTFFAYADGQHREDGNGNRELMQFVVEQDNDLPDGLMADVALDELERLSKSDRPFFLGLGFFKPHLPWVAPQEDFEAFENVDIELAGNREKPETEYWHRSGEFYRYRNDFQKSRPVSTEDAVEARRAYLACTRYVDRQVGKVLDQLEELGLEENTIVVVWGDHGWHLGEHDIWGKHSTWEEALRSVLMIRVPGLSKPRLEIESFVETIDIYPTLVELCDPTFQKTNWNLDGESLVPLLEGKTPENTRPAISFWQSAISIRFPDVRWVGKLNQQGPGDTSVSDWSSIETQRIDKDGKSLLASLDKEELAGLLERVKAEIQKRTNDAAAEDPFATDNLVAWCVVPFDAKKRNSRDRAAMLESLGLTKLAYDWRSEHVVSFETEILEMKSSGIEFFAFWDVHETFFELCEKHQITPQIWKTVPSPEGETDLERVEKAGQQLLPIVRRASELGCQVGLYNHGGWGGQPKNMIAVCEWLRKNANEEAIGIVYNMHHAHADWEQMTNHLKSLKPYLLCLNLNGMHPSGDPKIDILGNGPLDSEMIQAIRDIEYQGPIGILDHQPEKDAKAVLEANLAGLRKLVE